MLAPVALGEILTSLLAVWLLTALYRRDPDPPLRYWAAGFALQTVTTIAVAHRLWGPEILWASTIAAVAGVLCSVFLVIGTLKYLDWTLSRRWLWAPVGLVLLALSGLALGWSFELRAVPILVALGGSLIFVGVGVARDWANSVGARVAGLGLTLYGAHTFDYPLAVQRPALLPWGHALAAFLQVMICAGFVLLYFERASRRLAEKEARYRGLFDNAVVGIFVADESGKLVAANATLEGLISAGQPLAGRQLRTLFQRPEDAERMLGIDTPSLAEHTARFKTDDSRVLDLRIYTRRLTESEGSPLLEGVVVDVTRMESIERHLGQVQRAEAVGQLAGGIAHDINNVLTVVMASTDMLDRTLDGNPKTAQLLAGIREASQHGASLTRQLLTFTRKHPAPTEDFELGPRVEAAVSMLRPTFDAGVALELRAETSGCGVNADPALIEQLIVNLVLNARDAVADQGTILVRVWADQESTNLEVRDDGVGMNAETVRQSCEPFFTTKAQGTGLGLAVVQRVVKQSGALLEVESELGRGSVFRVRFPRARAEPAPRLLEPAPTSTGRVRARVLVVEDRDDVRAVLQQTLTEAGFEVVAPRTSEAAIGSIESGLECALLVTDIRMPGRSGPEVAAALRARSPQAPIIFISGQADEVERGELGLDARTRFLGKPFSPDELCGLARELLVDTRAPKLRREG